MVRRFARARPPLNPCPPAPLPSLSTRGVVGRVLPAILKPPPTAWPQEDCANEPDALHCFVRDVNSLGVAAAMVLLVIIPLFSLPASAAVRAVSAIGLTVDDLDRELQFYTKVLPFEKVGESQTAPGIADALLGLTNTLLRSAELRLGDDRVTLTEHLTNKGRPIPVDSRSFDHWFQHIAIVVSDMGKAYEHLRQHKVKHVSTAPQTLPAWNKDAGGIKAFYFRDPEDHVLEIIWFPPDKGDPKWQRSTTNLFLGIDHTAIVVSDTDRSLVFYRDMLGLKVVGGAENYGVEQEHLNQVFGARLRITALRAARGPGIEFLEYITPPGGRPLPTDDRANDLIFWRTGLLMDDLDGFASTQCAQDRRFVSKRAALAGGSLIVRDPDGHGLQLIEADN
jgi:catechol 2,3-dioxygenase-like lactoylglutathione lyase family enzyme